MEELGEIEANNRYEMMLGKSTYLDNSKSSREVAFDSMFAVRVAAAHGFG